MSMMYYSLSDTGILGNKIPVIVYVCMFLKPFKKLAARVLSGLNTDKTLLLVFLRLLRIPELTTSDCNAAC